MIDNTFLRRSAALLSAGGVLLASALALAVVLVSSQGVSNGSLMFDGNNGTFATAAGNYSPVSCPLGASFLGNRCLITFGGNNYEFKNYQVFRLPATEFTPPKAATYRVCGFSAGLRVRSSVAGVESLVFFREQGTTTWYYSGKVTSTTAAADYVLPTSMTSPGYHNFEFMIARSSAVGNPASDTFWYKFTASAMNTAPGFCLL